MPDKVDMTITSALLVTGGSIKPGANGPAARGRPQWPKVVGKYRTQKTQGYVGVSSLTRA